MEGFKRAGAGALLTVAMLAAAPAAHAAGVGVTQISSLPAGAKAGNLTGVVTNESDRAARAEVSVRVMRRKTGGALIGKTSLKVAAHGTKTFMVGVKVPNLKKGTYYVAACTPQGGADKGALGCATSAADLKIGGGDPVRGKLAQRQFDEARKELDPLLDTIADRPEIQEMLAEIEVGRGRFQEAIVRYDRQFDEHDLEMLPSRPSGRVLRTGGDAASVEKGQPAGSRAACRPLLRFVQPGSERCLDRAAPDRWF